MGIRPASTGRACPATADHWARRARPATRSHRATGTRPTTRGYRARTALRTRLAGRDVRACPAARGCWAGLAALAALVGAALARRALAGRALAG